MTVPTEDLRALRAHGDRLVRDGDADHAVNVLAGGPPGWVSDAVAGADLSRYPDAEPARRAVARLHGRDPAEVVLTNGASEALWVLATALAPRVATLVQPGFTETEASLHAQQVPVMRCHAPADVPDRADLVVVTNPTSPDGRLRERADLLALRRAGRTLVVDEAFMSMVPGEAESLAQIALPDVIVVRSLTKLLAVAGLRVGYALAPVDLAERLRAHLPPWSVNAPALAVLAAVPDHRDDLIARARRAQTEREDLERCLTELPEVRIRRSHTNFVLIEVASGQGPALVAALRERRIAVRPAASFPGFGPDHIRLSARDAAANARLVAAIAEALA